MIETTARRDGEPGEIDTLRVDGPFRVERIDRSAFRIETEGRTFEAHIREGGRNARIAMTTRGRQPNRAATLEVRETQWPQGLRTVEVPRGGFHMEMMHDGWYAMVTSELNYDFHLVDGPARARITIIENSAEEDKTQ